jgi:S1-C subfamily serine protease
MQSFKLTSSPITYDSCAKAGLPAYIEEGFRSTTLSGLLSVKHVLPNSPNKAVFRPDDILISVESQYVNDFVELEDILDSNTGKRVELTVLRDRKLVSINPIVCDIQNYIPKRFLNLWGTIFNDISYNLAHSYIHAPKGVFLSEPGYMFAVSGIPSHSIIVSINNTTICCLDDILEIFKNMKKGQKFVVRFYSMSKKYLESVRIVRYVSACEYFEDAVKKGISSFLIT